MEVGNFDFSITYKQIQATSPARNTRQLLELLPLNTGSNRVLSKFLYHRICNAGETSTGILISQKIFCLPFQVMESPTPFFCKLSLCSYIYIEIHNSNEHCVKILASQWNLYTCDSFYVPALERKSNFIF